MYITTYETRHFEFIAVGTTPESAQAGLDSAVQRHGKIYPDCNAEELLNDIRDDGVNLYFIPCGEGINMLSSDCETFSGPNNSVSVPLTINTYNGITPTSPAPTQRCIPLHGVSDMLSHASQLLAARKALREGRITEAAFDALFDELDESLSTYLPE